MNQTSKIDHLIAKHERLLEALKVTRNLLRGEATTQKQNGTNTALAAALAREAKRQPVRRTAGHHGPTRKIRAQRERSKAFLDQFDPSEPRPLGHHVGLGSLVRRGYLKRKGDGYVRTTKEYHLQPWLKSHES